MSNAMRAFSFTRRVAYGCFDDDPGGLNEEPFVAGAPEIIDGLVSGLNDAGKGFALYFSGLPFPGSK